MKKLLIMIGLIGSVYSNEITSWDGLIGYCTNATDITETINGNEITYTNVYTLNGNYNFNLTGTVNMPSSTKLVIPEGITLNLTNGGYRSFYMKNNSVIEVNGILNKGADLYGPNEAGSEDSYTNAYIIVNGELNNNGNIYTNLSNSSITFSGTGGITNTGKIVASSANSSITFSNTGGITNIGGIYTYDSDSSITVSKDTTIRNKGGSIYLSTYGSNTALILDGTLIFEKGEGEDGKYPAFNTVYNSYYMVISGSGTIDMSPLRNADMTAFSANHTSTTQGCINIPKESFSSTTPFTGTIKLPYNTRCYALDLTNATGAKILVPVLKQEGVILDGSKITKGEIIKELTDGDPSVLKITLPDNPHSTYEILRSTPFTLASILASEYNAAENYIITDELDDTTYETSEEVTVNFGIQGQTPLDLRGTGTIIFTGDNSGYKIPRPKIKFTGANSVFPRDAIYDHVEFGEGSVIPENTIIVAKNRQNLSSMIVKGHLILE